MNDTISKLKEKIQPLENELENEIDPFDIYFDIDEIETLEKDENNEFDLEPDKKYHKLQVLYNQLDDCEYNIKNIKISYFQ